MDMVFFSWLYRMLAVIDGIQRRHRRTAIAVSTAIAVLIVSAVLIEHVVTKFRLSTMEHLPHYECDAGHVVMNGKCFKPNPDADQYVSVTCPANYPIADAPVCLDSNRNIKYMGRGMCPDKYTDWNPYDVGKCYKTCTGKRNQDFRCMVPTPETPKLVK